MSEAVIEADCVEFVLEAENWSEHEACWTAAAPPSKPGWISWRIRAPERP